MRGIGVQALALPRGLTTPFFYVALGILTTVASVLYGGAMAESGAQRRHRKQVAELLAKLAEGVTDEVAQAELAISPARFERLKKEVFDLEAERVRSTPTEHTYIQYCLAQMGCIKDLHDLLKEAKTQKNANASVGAIRARSDIYDKLIKTGQEFGILEKKPEEKRIIAGVIVANLSNDQLKQAITSAIGSLNDMVSSFGDLDITKIEPGTLHYELPQTSKTNRAKANRVHGGRRVVKQIAT